MFCVLLDDCQSVSQLPAHRRHRLHATRVQQSSIDDDQPRTSSSRIFPFHPVCRGHNAGKRSSSFNTSPNNPLRNLPPPSPSYYHDTEPHLPPLAAESLNKAEHILDEASRLIAALNSRKYTFAPKCRGTTSKRSAIGDMAPTEQSYWDQLNVVQKEEGLMGGAAPQAKAAAKQGSKQQGKLVQRYVRIVLRY